MLGSSGRRAPRTPLLLALVSCLLAAGDARAQLQRPSEEFQLPPPTFEEKEKAPEIERRRILPPITPLPRPALKAGVGVRVDAYRFEGNTVFTNAELGAVLAPWTGREIATEELEGAREALTRHYVERGYVSSGALLPDQEVADGTVTFQIVEGRLRDVVVADTRFFRKSYFESRLMLGADQPLRVQDLESRLQVFEQNDWVRRLAARLGPGDRKGDAILHLQVQEELPFRLGFEYANDTPVTLGEHTAHFEGEVANLMGLGDSVYSRWRQTEGLWEYDGRYRVPVTPWDTQLDGHFRYSDGEISRGVLKDANIDSNALTAGFSVIQPLWRTPRTTTRVALIGEWRRSETEIDGVGISFPGSGASSNGVSKLSLLRGAAEWIYRGRTQVVAFRQLATFGLPILNATKNPFGLPDRTFISSLSQLRWAMRFPRLRYTELSFRGDLQLSNDPLMTIEQIAAGGLDTVRGYPENQLIRDQAVIASLELRLPVYGGPTRNHFLQLAPFVDVAHGWNRDRVEEVRAPDDPNLKFRLELGSESETLVGIGAGLRYRFRRLLRAELYWGTNLTSDARIPSSLQNHGLHLRVRADLP
jgi:hemolysin activation/secretion protein